VVEQLFGSKTRVKLLHLFYGNPNRSFYVREITRKIDEQINSVRRELSNLLSIGIISSDTQNNKLYYEVNQKFEYYDPLAQIFGSDRVVNKSVTGDDLSSEARLKKLGNVELAFFTGQFTRDESSGVDLLIVGDINQTQLEKYITELEEKEGKDIRFAVMTPKDFAYREQVNDRFILLALAAKKQTLIDKNNRLSGSSKDESTEEVKAKTKEEK
jgi:hypothetical protein